MNYGGNSQSQDRDNALIAEIKTLTVERLKQVLRHHGSTVSGIKSELQMRIISQIEVARQLGDLNRIERIRQSVKGASGYAGNSYPSPYSINTPTSSASPQFPSPSRGIPSMSSTSLTMPHSSPYMPIRLTFNDSAFYTIIKPLSTIYECKARENTRDTARLTVSLTNEVAEQLRSEPNYRVMVFCAADSANLSYSTSEIAFPHQVELKCNSNEIKTNLRGLKNKPGSTRPADITHQIQKRIGYQNSVEMIYALTKTKFYLVVNLLLKKTMRSLVETLRRGKFISKDQVISEMKKKNSDDDIQATSTKLPLKCPLSFTRIETPCRSFRCDHIRCFDAKSYLLLQEQAPLWMCPICDKPAPWENLVIDAYVDDILKNTNANVEQVTIEPDGVWYAQNESKSKFDSKHTPSDDEDDDDYGYNDDDDDEELVEISANRMNSNISKTATSTTFSTPINAGSMNAPKSNKRPREEVIDLTLSDDDESAAPPSTQVKRTFSATEAFRPRPPDAHDIQFHLPRSHQLPTTFDFNRFSTSS